MMGLRYLRIAVLALATVVAGAPALPAAATVQPGPSLVADPAAAVNTFIGTKGDGNTFPGAAAPFGMIQESPIGEHYAGYHYDDPKIRGIGHMFLSGAGCWEQGGIVGTMPVTGDIGPGAAQFDTTKAADFDSAHYGSAYTHKGEVGTAGDYRVKLTDYGGIGIETTAGTRAGFERYTFAKGSAAKILVNVGQANVQEPVSGSSVRIVDDHTIEGSVTAQAFCNGDIKGFYTTYFTTRFDQPFHGSGTWSPQGGAPGSTQSSGGQGLRGAWVSFGGQQVTARTSISYVDSAGARTNLDREGNLPFDAARALAVNRWRSELSSIRIPAENRTDARIFYTSLYHVLLQPTTGSDADGRYRGTDQKIHRAGGWTYYQFLSLWDTYRGQNQLLALLRPQRAHDIAKTILTVRDQGGWLPRWAYASYETDTMTGDPVTPYLADLWKLGALHGMENRAYAALKQNVNEVPPASSMFSGRAGNPSYLKNGYVQYDENFPKKGQDVDPVHGASATFEYGLADCSLAQLAAAQGDNTEAAALRKRGNNYANLWDPSSTDRGFTGFPRPKLGDGSWYSPPDKPYTPEGQDGFHEGTAWQYQWMYQQNVPAMTKLMGGEANVEKRLDDYFAYSDLIKDPKTTVRKEWVVGPYSYYNQFRYNPNNEPDLHSPWMYALTGNPAKTSAVVRAAQTLFTNAPNGVTGNDDLGEMSAWYVFSALGMYPVTPGSGQFVVNAPRFGYALAQFGGRPLQITAHGANSGIQYISGMRVNGAPSNKVYVDIDQLINGGWLDFDLTSDPAAAGNWGTAPDSAPPPQCG